MHARDAAGRSISLLNDDDYDTKQPSHGTSAALRGIQVETNFYPYVPQTLSTPNTPELLRTDSFESRISAEPVSPVTPLYEPAMRYIPRACSQHSAYDDYYPEGPIYAGVKRRPSDFSDGRSVSYDDEPAASPSQPAERPGKRFPCRYRETHGCEKTFTTSGHASRHSKIHTAEKAVPCSFKGCTKKFTRADNMKQHLETHYKDKARAPRPSLSSADRRTSSSSSSRQAAAASSRSSKPSAHAHAAPATWERSLPLHSSQPAPPAVTSPASALDTLAWVVSHQPMEKS